MMRYLVYSKAVNTVLLIESICTQSLVPQTCSRHKSRHSQLPVNCKWKVFVHKVVGGQFCRLVTWQTCRALLAVSVLIWTQWGEIKSVKTAVDLCVLCRCQQAQRLNRYLKSVIFNTFPNWLVIDWFVCIYTCLACWSSSGMNTCLDGRENEGFASIVLSCRDE